MERRVAMRKLRLQLSVLLLIVFISPGFAAIKSGSLRTFKAILSGNEEVPPVKTKAKGEVKFQSSKEGDQLTYTLIISGIKDVTSAYLQKGRKGENGPPVIDLFPEPKREDVSGTLLAEGKVEPYLLIGPLKGKSLNSLIQLMEVGDVYVNIQTKKHPDGEVRGQIK
jgi:CHRD domain